MIAAKGTVRSGRWIHDHLESDFTRRLFRAKLPILLRMTSIRLRRDAHSSRWHKLRRRLYFDLEG